MPNLRMSAMNVGPLTCAKNLLVAFAPGTVDAPTTSVVIEHPEHGVVLWDTGINEAVADPERGDEYWGPGLRTAFGTQQLFARPSLDNDPGRNRCGKSARPPSSWPSESVNLRYPQFGHQTLREDVLLITSL